MGFRLLKWILINREGVNGLNCGLGQRLAAGSCGLGQRLAAGSCGSGQRLAAGSCGRLNKQL